MFGEKVWRFSAVMIFSALVLIAVAWCRSYEYDETYSIFLTAGVARPEWPSTVFRAGDVRAFFGNGASLAGIAEALRATDVHPPLYFWVLELWRRLIGSSWFDARLLSVASGLAGLGCVAAIARLVRVNVIAAVLMTVGCYGYAYTAGIARGFALAEVLALSAVVVVLLAERGKNLGLALAAGVLLGLAMTANYLASFIAVAAFLWLAFERRWQLFLVVLGGWALFLPLDVWFFLAQRGSREGQFPPFAWWPSILRMGRCYAAALAGGIPLYVPGLAGKLAAVAIGAGLLLVGLVVVRQWSRLDESRRLLGLGAAMPAAGLMGLGLLFNNTPVEIRYFSFGAPFCALLAAGAAGNLTGWKKYAFGLGLGAVQAASIAGLLWAPQTVQPSRSAAEAASLAAATDGVALVAWGNDGVGVPGPFVAQLPDRVRILVVRPHVTQRQVEALVLDAKWVVVPALQQDKASAATLASLRMLADGRCWRDVGSSGKLMILRHLCDRD